MYAKIANSFRLSACYFVDSWKEVELYSCHAGLFDQAKEAVKHISEHYVKYHPLATEYWSQKVEYYQRLSELKKELLKEGHQKTTTKEEVVPTENGKAKKGNTKKGNTKKGNTKKGNTKKGNTKKGNTKKGNTKKGRESASQATKSDNSKVSSKSKPKKKEAVLCQQHPSHEVEVEVEVEAECEGAENTDITVLSSLGSLPDEASELEVVEYKNEWTVKHITRNLEPYERLLQINWNKLIIEKLIAIDNARLEGDLQTELEIYRTIFDNPKLNNMIGIERLWEEYAWTLMRSIEYVFQSNVMHYSQEARHKVLSITDQAEEYALKALSMKLHSPSLLRRDLEPEVIYEDALKVLKETDYQPKDVNLELKRRLRYLFSTMGHVYSIRAMASRAFSKKLSDVARKWYGYKSIDPEYQ